MANPLAQFKVNTITTFDLLGYSIDFTNSSMYMLIALSLSMLLLFFSTRTSTLVPSKFQSVGESLYELISNMIIENAGQKGVRYAPIILSLFLFILFCNLLGMLPYSFTVTSQIVVTFSLAMIVFLMITFVGFIKHGTGFLSLFLPKGTPWWLAPLMIVIELFSFLSKPISLSLRLAANMMAGHVLLKVVAGFITMAGILLKSVEIPFMMSIMLFEVFVAILQAYIFTMLSCVYLNDALNLH